MGKYLLIPNISNEYEIVFWIFFENYYFGRKFEILKIFKMSMFDHFQMKMSFLVWNMKVLVKILSILLEKCKKIVDFLEFWTIFDQKWEIICDHMS